MKITENNNDLPEGLITILKNAVVDNFNEHKKDYNKELTRDEVLLISVIQNDVADEVYMMMTTRKVGLLYALHVVDSNVTLYLYNRIGRKVLAGIEHKGDN